MAPTTGERTPEQGNGDSTPVYGSFEEDSFELEEDEVSWEQQLLHEESQVKVAPDNSSTVDSGQQPVKGKSIPENNEASFPIRDPEKEDQEELALQPHHDTVLAAPLDQEEGSDLETEESDQQPLAEHNSCQDLEEEPHRQDLSLDSDVRPGSPEPLGLVEDLQEEEELDWDEVNMVETVSHCRKIRNLLVEDNAEENSGSDRWMVDDLTGKKGVIKSDSGDLPKLVVVDSCIFLARLPLVKEFLRDERFKLYMCYQVAFNYYPCFDLCVSIFFYRC